MLESYAHGKNGMPQRKHTRRIYSVLRMLGGCVFRNTFIGRETKSESDSDVCVRCNIVAVLHGMHVHITLFAPA